MPKILIAHDHDAIHGGGVSLPLAAANRNWDLCGEERVGSAYNAALQTRPDVVVLDITRSVVEGISLARLLRDDLPSAKTLLFTRHYDVVTVTSAVAAGVTGYVLRSERERRLAIAINRLAQGRTCYSMAVINVIADANGTRFQKDRSAFTPRELEVTRLIANGHTSKTAASQLGIGTRTVRTHRTSALRKAGVRTNADLVSFAIRQQLIAAG